MKMFYASLYFHSAYQTYASSNEIKKFFICMYKESLGISSLVVRACFFSSQGMFSSGKGMFSSGGGMFSSGRGMFSSGWGYVF